MVEHRIDRLETAIEKIAGSLTALVRLESEHLATRQALARAFGGIEDHERRLRGLEIDVPPLKETRRWIIAGLLAVFAAVSALIWNAAITTREPKTAAPIVAPTDVTR